jgi:hypothetical protein
MIFSYSCNRDIETCGLIEIDARNYLHNNFQLSEVATDVKYIFLSNDVLVSVIKDLKVINHDIFVQVEDTLLIKYDLNGGNPQIIGSYGRGPGEYQFIASFAVDYKTGTIYIVESERTGRIKIYSRNGVFKSNLDINEGTGLRISDIEYFNSHLFLAQYLRTGNAEYNWVIADTLGNIVSYKRNDLPPFRSRLNRRGGILKYENWISYWDEWTDTIYTISPDLSYSPTGYFMLGEHRNVDDDYIFFHESPQQIIEALSKICNTLKILETADFIIYNFFYLGRNGVSFINKSDRSVLSSFKESSTQGTENDLDNGPGFTPFRNRAKNS